jgi:carnitine O-octanoyltransferase
VEKWWEDYAYLTSRLPLLPYCTMAQPMIITSVGVEESRENRLKALSRCLHNSAVFWKLLREEKLRPPTNPDGSITFSANLYRRLCNSVRIPGEGQDALKTYFKTGKKFIQIHLKYLILFYTIFVASEGSCHSHTICVSKGRIFYMQTINDDGSLCTPQQILYSLKIISDSLESSEYQMGIPILTCDDRDTWAKVQNNMSF